jgi:hypothetical protein
MFRTMCVGVALVSFTLVTSNAFSFVIQAYAIHKLAHRYPEKFNGATAYAVVSQLIAETIARDLELSLPESESGLTLE